MLMHEHEREERLLAKYQRQMTSVGSFLFAGNAPTPAAQGSDTSTQSPSWLEQYMAELLGASRDLASTPYSRFPGPTVAQPSTDTTRAWDMAGQNVGAYRPLLDSASSMTQGASGPINPADISRFINPFQDYVTGALNRNLNENILPTIQDKFVMSGQSRSPQEQEITQRAGRDTQIAAGQAMAGGYQGALNSLMSERDQQRQGGSQMGVLAGLQSQLGATDVGNLAAAGQARDANAQANLDAARNQFNEERDYPYQQVGFLSNILRGFPTQAAGSTTQSVNTGYPPAYQPSPFASILSALGGNSYGLARGGRVPTREQMLGALARAA